MFSRCRAPTVHIPGNNCQENPEKNLHKAQEDEDVCSYAVCSRLVCVTIIVGGMANVVQLVATSGAHLGSGVTWRAITRGCQLCTCECQSTSISPSTPSSCILPLPIMAQLSTQPTTDTAPSSLPKIDSANRNASSANGHSLSGASTSDANSERSQIINDEKEFK